MFTYCSQAEIFVQNINTPAKSLQLLSIAHNQFGLEYTDGQLCPEKAGPGRY